MNRLLGVIVKLLNHFITSSVFFHWFSFIPVIVLLFIEFSFSESFKRRFVWVYESTVDFVWKIFFMVLEGYN